MPRHPDEHPSARAQLAWFLLWSGCLLVSLRAAAPPDARLAWVTAPLRFAADLAAPLHLLRAPEVHAAENRLVRASSHEAEEHVRLLEALAYSAEPREAGVRARCLPVPGEVVGRLANEDRIRVHLRDGRAVQRGQPVACGDAYVGRVLEVIERRSDGGAEVVVELVTARDFSVGGRIEREGAEPVYLVVGGLVARPYDEDAVELFVRHPSDRSVRGGLVRVFERFEEAEPYAHLAEGLHLGELVRSDRDGKPGFHVLPELDYQYGLFHVVVLVPRDAVPEGLSAGRPGLADERWLRVRSLVAGDPSPWRSTTKIGAGRLAGVLPGAAVTGVGGRLLGRVVRSGPLASDVGFLDDVGLSLVAVATIEGLAEPRVVGRLVSEGRDAATGAIAMRWKVRVRLGEREELVSGSDGRATVRARLFTGSGDEGLPAGLFFGEAELPLDAEPNDEPRILVENDVEGRDVRALFVRALPVVRSAAAGSGNGVGEGPP